MELVYIYGSGKSGSTWITELLGYNSDIIFEPFSKNSKFYKYAFTDNMDNFNHGINETIQGNNNDWCYRLSQLGKEKIIIKMIRQPFLIDEIEENIKQIYIYRNPIYTINSQYRNNWSADYFFKMLYNNHYLMEIIDKEYLITNIYNSNSRFKKLVLRFCIENWFIQNSNSFKSNLIHIISYEDICSDYINIIPSFQYINENVPCNLKGLWKKRSMAGGEKLYNKPKKELIRNEIKFIRQTIETFNLKLVI